MPNQTYTFLVTLNFRFDDDESIPPEYEIRELIGFLPHRHPDWFSNLSSVSVESVTVKREQQEQDD